MSPAETTRRRSGEQQGGPAPLDEAHTRALAQRLQRRARELVSEIRSVGEERSLGWRGAAAGTGVCPRDPGDEGDEAEQRTRQAVRDAEALRDIDELRAVEAALARIEAGTYGECVDCSAVIAARRLDVQPTAARCLPCQELHEGESPSVPRPSP